ncbi:MAG: hypothetical protein HN353_08585 [Bdellovibrionales bacterium]|jgi:hypothetical protein|nr:hypothetical protein [Bdellovibrionales bacterium]MBT3526878.1 hypothetical protein [Bdellovibrionales bacterium]MBT7669701.1 hypothetical protein [Bdellovibrionales bacterium]MBT7765785.1 hypothetical protein [Bdellovibrionales bacterium]
MSENDVAHNYVFFLQLSTKLPDYFIRLSAALAPHNIQLVPVTWRDISELIGRDRRLVVAVVPDISRQRNFNLLRARNLDFWLNRRHINLIHVSTFQQINDLFVTKDSSVYTHLKLPTTISQIAMKIIEKHAQVGERKNRWPGGRRGKLPDSQP